MTIARKVKGVGMETDFAAAARRGRLVVTGVALALIAAGAAAQSGPPPAGAPPGGPPGGGSAAPDAGAAAAGAVKLPGGFQLPPMKQLTPEQVLAASLPAPQKDFGTPLITLPPAAPMPSSNPRDLEGGWSHDTELLFRTQADMYGQPIPYKPAAVKVLQRRVLSLKAGKPFLNASAICRPPGVKWTTDLSLPFRIFQTKDYVEVIFQEYHSRWYILLNPAFAPPSSDKEYSGRSVGHWEGNTLVVETTGQKQATWLDVDGTPMSTSGKLTWRIRKVMDQGSPAFLEIVTVVDDPTYYTQPWSVVRRYGWNPFSLREYNCEEQIGDPSVSEQGGLIPEPTD